MRVRLTNASLASQAVAPPLSDREMSARGRSFPDLARKLLSARPLAQQQVHPEDSVLGDNSRWPRRGLHHDAYARMIRSAFQPDWWKSSKHLRIDGNDNVLVIDGHLHKHPGEYSLMEYNFALFFGLAIQLYEATLITDDTPYDRFMTGNASAISEAAVRGVDLFRSQTRGRCINCHEGAELTGASVTRVSASPVRIREEQALDRGFNNIGVRPSLEDLFLGANDPFGNPLANVRRLATPPNCANGEPCPVVADGLVKVPGLRIVELTAPYFRNGGTLTLRGVLDFYSRGGDYAGVEQIDGSKIAPLNVLNNTDQEKGDLEAWLLSLTDERVRHQQAPFDHPQLFVANGHPGDSTQVLRGRNGNAADSFIEIPAVGRQGDVPLKRFLEN